MYSKTMQIKQDMLVDVLAERWDRSKSTRILAPRSLLLCAVLRSLRLRAMARDGGLRALGVCSESMANSSEARRGTHAEN